MVSQITFQDVLRRSGFSNGEVKGDPQVIGLTVGGKYLSSPATLTNGQFSALTFTNDQKLRVDATFGGSISVGNVKMEDGATTTLATINAANTARTVATTTMVVQNVSADGTVMPSGSAVTNAPFSKITDGTSTLDILVQNAAFGTSAKGLAVFGKYLATPTVYDAGDAVPLALDSEGKPIISKSYTLSDGVGNVGALLSTPTGVNNDAPLVVMPVMFNGTTWDRLSGNATSGLDVSIYNSTVNAANTARTTATTVICVQPIDAAGNVITGGGSGVSTPTTIVGGSKDVTTAGVRVALGTTMTAKQIYIRAKSTNTGVIYVGGITVDSTNGIALGANDSVTLEIADRATVYIDSSVSLEGCGYTVLN